MAQRHRERHRLKRVGWLRAAVLGANDGIVSTASLLVGVAAADASHGGAADGRHRGRRRRRDVDGRRRIRLGQLAGRQRARRSRARAPRARDRRRRRAPRARGHLHGARLEPELAKQVADALMAHDALGAHARDELGITELSIARPLQAAAHRPRASRAARCCRSRSPRSLPVPSALVAVRRRRSSSSPRSAPSPRAPAAPRSAWLRARVTFWGALAMAATAGIGELFGTIVQ